MLVASWLNVGAHDAVSRLKLFLAFYAVLTSVSAPAEESASITVDFPSSAAEGVEQRLIESYLRRSGTLRCEIVAFDVQKLVELIESLDNGDVDESSIHLKIFGADLGEFVGIHSEVLKEGEAPGPYAWGGTLRGAPHISVNFVVDRFHIATMILDAGDIVYRAHVSRSSGNYFLCKTDGARPHERVG